MKPTSFFSSCNFWEPSWSERIWDPLHQKNKYSFLVRLHSDHILFTTCYDRCVYDCNLTLEHVILNRLGSLGTFLVGETKISGSGLSGGQDKMGWAKRDMIKQPMLEKCFYWQGSGIKSSRSKPGLKACKNWSDSFLCHEKKNHQDLKIAQIKNDITNYRNCMSMLLFFSHIVITYCISSSWIV